MRSPGALSGEGKRGGLTDAEDSATDWLGQQGRAREHEGPEAASVILHVCAERGCNALTPTRRCARHPRRVAHRNQRLRTLVAASASVCPECGETPTPANPMTADHRIAQVHGGKDEPRNLRPMCRRCNGRLGAELVNG